MKRGWKIPYVTKIRGGPPITKSEKEGANGKN